MTHVIQGLDPATGGPPQVLLRLAAGQATQGISVRVLALEHPATRDLLLAYPALATIPGGRDVEHVPLPSQGGLLARLTMRHLRATLAREAREADFFHLHGPWEMLPAAAARAVGTPYTMSVHGALHPWSLAQSRLKKALALRLWVRGLLNGAAFVHATTRDEEQALRAIGVRVPIEVIPNGVFLEEIPPPGARAPGPHGAAPAVIFLGRLHHKKGLDFLAAAFARVAKELPEARLLVIGPDEGAKDGFERDVKALGIADRVSVEAPRYGPAKYDALRASCVFCLPSRQEGFSVAIVEALACGCPVVVSKECGFPEVASEGVGSVVDLDAEAIADALLAILRDAALRERMSARALALVRERYAWGRLGEMTKAAYLRVIGVRPKSTTGG